MCCGMLFSVSICTLKCWHLKTSVKTSVHLMELLLLDWKHCSHEYLTSGAVWLHYWWSPLKNPCIAVPRSSKELPKSLSWQP